MKFPKNLSEKLIQREQNNALRSLPVSNRLIDFSSNDYLGFSRNENIFDLTHQYLVQHDFKINGATGSRLISGNHELYHHAEDFIAQLNQNLDLPNSLSSIGVTREVLPQMIDGAINDHSTATNPRSLSKQDFTDLFEQVF